MAKPAARVGDMHNCPMVDGIKPHVGGPIMPPGVVSVLIGGLPAATFKHKCACTGPLDVIILGSTSVKIGGNYAARIGDITSHGGVIVAGEPSVLIGDIITTLHPCAILAALEKEPQTEEEKKEQIRLLDELQKAIWQNIDNFPKDKRVSILLALQQYQKSFDALEHGRLANAVYDGKTPLGYEQVKGKELEEKFGLTDNFMADDESGFKSAIYKSSTGKEPEYTVAFAGTDDWGDVKTDVIQGIGKQDEQYDRAMLIGKKMRRAVGPDGFSTTGHSLGGGLASAASAVSGAEGKTYNAAGLHGNTTARECLSENERARNSKKVDAYYNSHDPLNRLQDNREIVLLTGGTTLRSKLMRIKLYKSGASPQAYGNRIKLKSRNMFGAKHIMGHFMGTMLNLLEFQVKQDFNNLKELLNCP